MAKSHLLAVAAELRVAIPAVQNNLFPGFQRRQRAVRSVWGRSTPAPLIHPLAELCHIPVAANPKGLDGHPCIFNRFQRQV